MLTFNCKKVVKAHWLPFSFPFLFSNFDSLLPETMASMPPKKPKYFTPHSKGYLFLAQNFQQFDKSEGNSGIGPFISKKQGIDSIYKKYSVFSDYSKSTFPQHFCNLANKYKIAKFKEQKRAESPSKFFYYFMFSLCCCLSHPYLLPATFEEGDQKKRKFISFKDSSKKDKDRLDNSLSLVSSASPSTAASILKTPTEELSSSNKEEAW